MPTSFACWPARRLLYLPAAACGGDVAEYFTSHFQFADPTVTVSASGGVIRQQGRSFTHAYELHLERATLLYDFSVIDGQPVITMPVTVLTAGGKVIRPKLRTIDSVASFTKQLTEAARAIESGSPSPVLDGGLAVDALRICQAETTSLISGKPVKIS